MLSMHSGKDAVYFAHELLSNQFARFAPKLYIDLTHKNGRGDDVTPPAQIADYFIQCFANYQEQLGLKGSDLNKYLVNKVVLEYGPGDTMCMALLMYAHGAKRVRCVDRFPLSKLSEKNIEVYHHLINSLNSAERSRAYDAFNERGNPKSGFNPEAISYQVTKDGLSGAHAEYDLIISCAVLEHVNSLDQTMLDIKNALKPAGLAIHRVDLKSHGLDRHTDFDFLACPPIFYELMFSHKGVPNRWRVNKYRELAEKSKLSIKKLIPTGRIELDKVENIYRKVAKNFGDISLDEFSWLGFWMHLEHCTVKPKSAA